MYMDKLWYSSRISIFEMLPMIHFNALPKGTTVQTPDTYREGLFFVKEGKLTSYK